MITLQRLCERPLPVTVRIEVFCRLVDSLAQSRKRRAVVDADVSRRAAADIVVGGNDVEAGAIVDHVGLLRVAEVVFALRPSRLVHETSPGAPWVLEHIVARLRDGVALAPDALLRALAPHRSGALYDDDDAALVDVRGREARALVAAAARLAAAAGPGEAVLWALDEAARVDPEFGEPRDRRARVAQSAGLDVDRLRSDVQQSMQRALRGDVTAATRVAEVLYGPGADPGRVLDPLGTALSARRAGTRSDARPRAALAIGVVGVVVLCASAGAGIFFAARPTTVEPPTTLRPPTPEPAPEPPPEPTPEPTPQATPTPTTLPALAVINVWLENCGDCMPTFEAWRALVEAGGVPGGARVENIAYGSEQPTTRDFAARYHVDGHLSFDVDGSRIVQRTGIGTFTTFVTDDRGVIVWRGRAVDAGFAANLARAYAQAQAGAEDFTRRRQKANELMFGGDFDAGRTLLEQLEQERPDDAMVQRALGIACARLRRKDEARTHYERYLQLAPEAHDAAAVRQLLAR